MKLMSTADNRQCANNGYTKRNGRIRLRFDPKEKNTVTLWGIAWKAILSEAVVTEGEALGISMLNSCLEGSTSYQTKYIARYCLTDSSPHASNPGTVSRVTTATLSTALQADRNMFFFNNNRDNGRKL